MELSQSILQVLHASIIHVGSQIATIQFYLFSISSRALLLQKLLVVTENSTAAVK